MSLIEYSKAGPKANATARWENANSRRNFVGSRANPRLRLPLGPSGGLKSPSWLKLVLQAEQEATFFKSLRCSHIAGAFRVIDSFMAELTLQRIFPSCIEGSELLPGVALAILGKCGKCGK